MSLTTIQQTVESLFSSWTSTPISWSNVEPRDHSDPEAPFLYDGSVPYISVEVLADLTEAITVPVRCKRYHGDIMVDVHVPVGTGSRAAMALFDSLNTLLQYKTLENNIRVKNFNMVGGAYHLRQGWRTYSAHWPLEAEF